MSGSSWPCGAVFQAALAAALTAASCAESSSLTGVPDLPDGWTKIEPGGETACAHGTPYAFYVRPGKINKLSIYFQGGGACWNALSCAFESSLLSTSAEDRAQIAENMNGVVALDNPDNPFMDWYGVFIPYCTGDVQMGNRVVTYPAIGSSPEVTIYHRGFVNASSARAWIYENFKDPEFIFISGSSGGSPGSAMHAPYIADHYPQSDAALLGDCESGVAPQSFMSDSFPSWGAQENFPPWIPELANTPLEELTMAKAYVIVSQYYPKYRISQSNTVGDKTQVFYYTAMGGREDEWRGLQEKQTLELAEKIPAFRYYMGWGDNHCYLPHKRFYKVQVNGVRLRDWVADMANGRDVPNVHCTDCETQEFFTP
ncbi:MAG: hypothetical protein HYY13_05670 [Nitrospirae bacterium]|nr:hypothetical protein [Nitrospirota bacterium]